MKLNYALRRAGIQAAAALAQNPFLLNLWQGIIFKGDSKYVCAPSLNCWSCPAAAGACPIGALQNVAMGAQYSASFYALGFLAIVGVFVGRLVCGFLCLFGFLQDLLYKIPAPKLRVPKRLDRVLRKAKYLVLVFLVLLLPAVATNNFGLGSPWFCEYLCPAGTIEAGIPLIATNPSLQAMLGALFDWKLGVAIAILVLAVFVSRPFCKYLCPLGAIYGLMNRISFVKLAVNDRACIQCGRCAEACPMDVEAPERIPTSAECIRCGVCKSVCPASAIRWSALKAPTLAQGEVPHEKAAMGGTAAGANTAAGASAPDE